MKLSCRSVQERLQEHFDVEGPRQGDGELRARIGGPVDPVGLVAAHLRTCRRCSDLYQGYLRFQTTLLSEAAVDLGELDPPDWGAILQARKAAWTAKNSSPGVHSPRTANDLPAHKALLPLRRLPAVVLFLLLVGVGALFGYRQYGLIKARSFVRSDTVAFVDSFFSEPFFATTTQSPLSPGADPSWFDATSAGSLSSTPPSPAAGSQDVPAPSGS